MTRQKNIHQEAIYIALSKVPSGTVIAYGQLAKLAGLINGARHVGRTLCELPEGSSLPWHRVVNAQGKISLPPESDSYREQEKRLTAEGVQIKNGRINFSIYGYNART